jgi:pimeloyl-ACP methyl ester carboxylesterase
VSARSPKVACVSGSSAASAYAKKFSGKYAHRIFKDISHNVPQEDPQAIAKAVIEVDGY